MRCWRSTFRLVQAAPMRPTSGLRRKSTAFPNVNEQDTWDGTTNVVRSPYDASVSDLNLCDFVWRNISQHLDLPAMICGVSGRSYKYKEMRGATFNLSVSMLNVLGLKVGDAVGMVMPNVPEFPVVFLGAASAGLVLTPANPLYTPEELSRQFKLANVRAVFTVAPLLEKVQAAIELVPGGCGPLVVAGASPGVKGYFDLPELTMRQVKRTDRLPDRPHPEQLVALPFSSGTTGAPKGVQLTHRNLVASINQMDHPQMTYAPPPCGVQERSLGVIPFFHIYGLQGALNMCLSRGYHVISLPKFESQTFSKVLHKFKPTMMGLVPPLIQFLTKSPTIAPEELKHLKLVTSGAAPLPKLHVDEFLAKANNDDLVFKEAYGLTETACMTAMMPNRYPHEKIGSCGVPVPMTELKVVDAEGRALPPGERGELLVRGPQVMRGYLNNPEATKETLSEDGWLRTGDIAYIDSDAYVFIVDRVKELIKVKGLQVSPTELEDILSKMDGVADVAVVGVDDDLSGEVPKAFVVKMPDSQVTAAQVMAFLEPRVAPFKQLKGGVQFVQYIPKNAAGKTLRKELKKM